MLNIKALRDQRAAKAKEARNLLDTNTGDKWSKDIENQVDAIYEEIDRIDAQISRAERQAKVDGDTAAQEQADDTRERTLANLSPEARERAERYSNAFRSFILNGERGMTNEEVLALREGPIQNAQSTGTPSEGGYLVPTGWGGQLLEALKAFGGMRNVANVISTAGGNPLPWPTVDESSVEGEIVAENAAASDGDAAFGTIQIGAYKYSSKVFTIPFELLQDAGPGIDVEAFVRRAAAQRIARITNKHFTTGTGVGQPQGIVTAAASGKVGTTGQTLTVIHDDLVDLEHSVDPAYRELPSVGFMFHDATLRNLKKLKDLEGRPLWQPGISVKEPDVLLGYRYTINQAMPVMAANAKSILFGDLHSYMIRDIMQVTLFRFDDSAFIKKGQIGFLAWSRHDGKLVTAGAPVKFYQNSAT
ncbi:phage major capsid protein [Sphingomonas koreensis]|uniref:Capsid protein n=1 Tax=Sphingomonas koreensis TaxID=93064 RepID=A0A1L6JC00_9SPHN|nr:phage major capsid protein [Sphingomonas koreensis]APR53357.1 capsid protein [Sphingomonas koreensis]RSU24521.1 phage major capsid protein [Sphingomonas koreensis]RSU25167.1 phage major capsid protein [Sphingomonas koreensis]RSU30158.1 phage major capsid protein [Sphingomonas koreensis]RSU37405.1 phage major capsid protein [Sphingomonas koreensis]